MSHSPIAKITYPVQPRKRPVGRTNQHAPETLSWLQNRMNILQATFNQLSDGLLLIDERGYIQEVNASLAEFFGSTIQDMQGQYWETLYRSIDPNFPGSLLSEAFKVLPEPKRIQHQRHNGEESILELSFSLISSQEQSGESYVLMRIVDVTQHMHLQTRMIESERFAASGRFAAQVAHEVNTPLQAIQTAIGLVQRSDNKVENDEYLGIAKEEVQRVASIVRQLLEIYKPEISCSDTVDVNFLVSRVLLLTQKWCNDKYIEVAQSLMPEITSIRGRSESLLQVLYNLMMNAIESMKKGGTLTVETTLQERTRNIGKQVHITISDTGYGIHPEKLPYIFDPFFTTKSTGVGLGLAISQEIVKEMGGHIEVSSELKKGTTFVVVLPYPYKRKYVPAWAKYT